LSPARWGDEGRSYVGTIALIGYVALAATLAYYDWLLALCLVVLTVGAMLIAAWGVMIGRLEVGDAETDTPGGAPGPR
jgi:hypothetical protein